jgi:hypothetical protein
MAAKPKSPKKTKLTDKEQSERFKRIAKELGANEGAEAFDRAIRKSLPPKKPSNKGESSCRP